MGYETIRALIWGKTYPELSPKALYPPQVKEATKTGLLVLHGGTLMQLLDLILQRAGPTAVLDFLRREGVGRPPVFKG